MVDAKPPPSPPAAAADDAETTNLKDEQRPPQVGEETTPHDDDTAAAAANLTATAAEPQQDVKTLVADAEDKDHPHPEPASPSVGDRLIANTHTDPAQDSKLKLEENEEEVNNASVANAKMGETYPSVNEDDKSSAQPAAENDDDKHVPSEIKLTKKKGVPKPPPKLDVAVKTPPPPPTKSFLSVQDGYESGTEDEQAAFMKDVESFHKVNNLEFKPPKFYKEELNLLKLWRQVIKLGGYEQVTSCKLWRQVGESFRPPKTCTTVSWTFRIFYEKALLEYEKGKLKDGDLQLPFSDGPLTEAIRVENQAGGSQALGSGRTRRDAAARAMKSWHSQRLLGNGEVCHPIIKDKNLSSAPKGDKQLKTNGLLKRKRPSTVEHAVPVGHRKPMKTQGDAMVIDVGAPADWVKINVQRTNDCFEVYALVPGLLREEVHVQSDPAGRLIISGQPEQLDNPWGVAPFKKVVSLPSRIDPHQTSAVVTLHGQLFVRVPFEQSDL